MSLVRFVYSVSSEEKCWKNCSVSILHQLLKIFIICSQNNHRQTWEREPEIQRNEGTTGWSPQHCKKEKYMSQSVKVKLMLFSNEEHHIFLSYSCKYQLLSHQWEHRDWSQCAASVFIWFHMEPGIQTQVYTFGD